jgi:Complex 1 protein (LYR family)
MVTGLQKSVLSLYRQALRTARGRDKEFSGALKSYARAELERWEAGPIIWLSSWVLFPTPICMVHLLPCEVSTRNATSSLVVTKA